MKAATTRSSLPGPRVLWALAAVTAILLCAAGALGQGAPDVINATAPDANDATASESSPASESQPQQQEDDEQAPPPQTPQQEYHSGDEFFGKAANITDKVEEGVTINGCNLLTGIGCGVTISAADVGVAAILNSVLGVLAFLAFGILRSHVKVYRARLASPATTVKPPPLPQGGVSQIWSWILPILRMSDQSILASAGLDALMYTRFLQMCVQFFLPVLTVSLGVLLPIHYTSMGEGYSRCSPEYQQANVNATVDKLIQTTVANVCPNEPLLWVHFVYVYLVLAWGMWLLQKHYVAYASLRHHHIGIPQKPNRWFQRYIQDQMEGEGDDQRSPTPTHASEEFLSPNPLSAFEAEEASAMTPNVSTASTPHQLAMAEEVHRRRSFAKIFSASTWKDTAKAWLMPDKLLDHRGEEPKDLKVFTSQLEYSQLNANAKRVSGAIARYNGEASLADVDNVIITNMSVNEESNLAMTAAGLRSLEEESRRALDREKSFAALKWWEVYTESYTGSKKGYKQEVMVRPSVRHIKGVNTTQDGLLVSVNASQYAVLITDIPRDSTQVNTLRRNFSREGNRGASLGTEEDFDGMEDIDPNGDICSEVFKQIFPDSFRHVVPVYDFSEVTKLLLRWDRAAQRLEILEALYALNGLKPTMRTGLFGLWGDKVDAIDHYQKLVQKLNTKIKIARRRAKFSAPSRCSFVIFDNQIDAAVAAQSVLLPLDGTKFVTHRAPGPDNVNWLSLFKTNNEKFVRRLLMLPLILFIIIFPSGFFLSAMTVLNQLFCTPTTPVYWEWYCETDSMIGILLKRLVTGWLPSLLITIWQNVIVTRVFYMVALVECVAYSLSGVDRRISSLYFYWGFFNIFLGSVLSGSLFTLIGQAVTLTNVRAILEVVGQGITNSSTFLTNYVLLRALFLVPFKLFFPHPGILNYVLRSILSVTCFKGVGITRRQRFQAWEPKSFMYGREAGTVMLMTLIGVVYCSTSPITVAVVGMYFLGMFLVVRHHLLYVYARNYEGGGELWPLLFDRFVIMLVTMAYFTACQLITKQAWPQAVVIFITAPIILWKFWSVCTKRYREVSENVPLDIGWRQPKAHVPPEMYIPSELRSQSVGWHPEQGKAWSGYGLPRWL